ncbi:MAG: hypothetical protein H7247_13170 [Polaromonas sp.]|nr:hypothetical protein [Gemmatimonadaceae bacterium]
MSASQQTDKSAGFTGLILGSIAIFVILFAIVRLTTAHYAGGAKEAGQPAAVEAPK